MGNHFQEIQSVVSCLPGLYLILKPDAPRFTIAAVSDAYTSATMTNREEILGKGLFEVFPDNPDDPEATGVANLTRSLNIVLKHKKPHEMRIQKYDIKRPGGSFEERSWLPKNLPVLDEGGKISHIIHCVTDVTASIKQSRNQQAADQEIAWLQQRHNSLIEQDYVAVAVFRGPEYVIEQANPLVCQIWGRTQKQVLNKPLFTALPEVKGQGLEELLNGVLESGNPFIGKELPIKLRRRGKLETVYFNFVYVPMRDKVGGTIPGITVLATDATEQVLVRQSVEESEERFRTLIEQSHEAITLSDEKGNYTYASPAIKRILGYTPKELMKINGFTLVHPDDTGYLAKRFKKLIKPGAVVTAICRFRHKDGSWRWVEATATNLLTDPVVKAIVSNVRDITERKQAEESIKISELRHRTMIEQSPLSMQILSPDGITLQVNKAWEELWGAKLEQLKGYNMLKDKQLAALGIMPYIQQGFKGLPTFIPAARYEPEKTIPGMTEVAYRWVQAYIYPVKDTRGAIREVVLIHQDITVQKKVEEALKDSEERWRFLAESMPEKIFTADTSGKTDYINPLWSKYTGLSLKESSKSDWTKLIHPEDVDENIRQWQHSLDTGKPFQIEHRIRRKDGEYRWHLTRAHALLDSNGKIVKWIGSNTDTEDLRRKQELEKMTAKLTEQRAHLVALSQAKDEFISLASHQLRTPATAVKQYLGMVLGGYTGTLTDAQTDMINQANTSNERQINTINDLLKVASLDSGKMQLQKSLIELTPLIRDVIDGQKSIFEERRQTIKFTPKQNGINAEIDQDRMRMVLENIIDNASKYTPEGKHIEVRLSKGRGKVIIAIQDEGVGIAESNLNKLFHKFSRLDNPLSILVGGTGLGLYWAKKVIDLHGGTIKVNSIPGEGSTFTISIPSRQA